MFLYVNVNILISKFTKKMNTALMKHFVHLNHGEAGTDAIKLAVVVHKEDGESVHRIHAADLIMRSVYVTHENVSLNGHLGLLLVNAQRKGFQS